jgi:Na+/H+ antiporter NhaB
MTLLPKDTVTVNKHNTAVCVRSEPLSTGDLSPLFPDYVAVQDDAADDTKKLLLDQKQRMLRSYLLMAASIAGLALGGALTYMFVDQHFVVADYFPFLIFSALAVVVLPLCFTSGEVSAEGLEINDTVYCNLTAEDRDVLFRAHAVGTDVYQEAVRILTERYTADEALRREERQQKVHTTALSVFNNTPTNARK